MPFTRNQTPILVLLPSSFTGYVTFLDLMLVMYGHQARINNNGTIHLSLITVLYCTRSMDTYSITSQARAFPRSWCMGLRDYGRRNPPGTHYLQSRFDFAPRTSSYCMWAGQGEHRVCRVNNNNNNKSTTCIMAILRPCSICRSASAS